MHNSVLCKIMIKKQIQEKDHCITVGNKEEI